MLLMSASGPERVNVVNVRLRTGSGREERVNVVNAGCGKSNGRRVNVVNVRKAGSGGPGPREVKNVCTTVRIVAHPDVHF